MRVPTSTSAAKALLVALTLLAVPTAAAVQFGTVSFDGISGSEAAVSGSTALVTDSWSLATSGSDVTGSTVGLNNTGSTATEGVLVVRLLDGSGGVVASGNVTFEVKKETAGTCSVPFDSTPTVESFAFVSVDVSVQSLSTTPDCQVTGGNSGGNAPPDANADVSPKNPQSGDTVTLDGSQSKDTDGTVVEYQWKVDTDGDGSYERTPTGETASYTYDGGADEVVLVVTDDDGATDRDTVCVPKNRNC